MVRILERLILIITHLYCLFNSEENLPSKDTMNKSGEHLLTLIEARDRLLRETKGTDLETLLQQITGKPIHYQQNLLSKRRAREMSPETEDQEAKVAVFENLKIFFE